MKPLRTIERVAYGDDCPDELADNVAPVLDAEADLFWQLFGVKVTALVEPSDNWGNRFTYEVESPVGSYLTIRVLEARWMARCAVAALAGCPPHWSDMGMEVTEDEGRAAWMTVTGPAVYAHPHGDGTWRVGSYYSFTDYPSELKARCAAADLLGVEWGPKVDQ